METDDRKNYRLNCPLGKNYVFGKTKTRVCMIASKTCTGSTKCKHMKDFDEGLV